MRDHLDSSTMSLFFLSHCVFILFQEYFLDLIFVTFYYFFNLRNIIYIYIYKNFHEQDVMKKEQSKHKRSLHFPEDLIRVFLVFAFTLSSVV